MDSAAYRSATAEAGLRGSPPPEPQETSFLEPIERTRRACAQARRAFEVVKAKITPSMTEIEIASELEYQARRFGAKRLSFEPIVGVGPRAALPPG